GARNGAPHSRERIEDDFTAPGKEGDEIAHQVLGKLGGVLDLGARPRRRVADEPALGELHPGADVQLVQSPAGGARPRGSRTGARIGRGGRFVQRQERRRFKGNRHGGRVSREPSIMDPVEGLKAAMAAVDGYYRERGIFQERFGFGESAALIVIDMAYG